MRYPDAMRTLLIPLVALLLTGCIARTAVSVVTLPVRAASQGADWLTTSQDEADRNRGRKLRKQEARDAKAQRKAARDARRQAARDD